MNLQYQILCYRLLLSPSPTSKYGLFRDWYIYWSHLLNHFASDPEANVQTKLIIHPHLIWNLKPRKLLILDACRVPEDLNSACQPLLNFNGSSQAGSI